MWSIDQDDNDEQKIEPGNGADEDLSPSERAKRNWKVAMEKLAAQRAEAGTDDIMPSGRARSKSTGGVMVRSQWLETIRIAKEAKKQEKKAALAAKKAAAQQAKEAKKIARQESRERSKKAKTPRRTSSFGKANPMRTGDDDR